MLSHLFSIMCIALIVFSCQFSYPMAGLKSAWQRRQSITRSKKPINARQYTLPQPPAPNPVPTINRQSMLERFKTFSNNLIDQAKDFFSQNKMNARIFTHGITETDVIYKIKSSPDKNFDTFLNYLKDIDQDKANIFLDQIMLSNPKDNEIGFLFSVISNQVFNNKRNSDALEKLSSWVSLNLMNLLKLPNTEDTITDIIVYLMGLDQKQKIGKQITLNLLPICQTSQGRYLIKEISLFGTELQKPKFKKYQQEVGRKIFTIWSNIVNALKDDKKTFSLLEDVLKTPTVQQILKMATIKQLSEIVTAKKVLEDDIGTDIVEITRAQQILETETTKQLLKIASMEQIIDIVTIKEILAEIKKYDAIQREKEIAETTRTIME